MKQIVQRLLRLLPILFLYGGVNLFAEEPVQLEILSQTAVSFTADQTSFVLEFPDFKKDAVTNSVSVSYSIQANEVLRTDDVVMARLDAAFDNIAFETRFISYADTAGNGDATLVSSQADFVAISTNDIGIARKEGGQMLDGSFVVTYRAQALEDQPAGEEVRTLTVTFAPT